MRRHNLVSKRSNGQDGFLHVESVQAARVSMQKRLALFSISDLCNTDEVAVLFICLPSRAIHDAGNVASFTRVKDRLTAVLTIFADGSKAPHTIIGKSKMPRSFRAILIP